MLDTLYGVLRLYDISPFTCEGAQFDPHRQRVVKTIKTQDESLFKTVSERLCRGYERNGVVLSREQVAAYVVEKE
ncbi:MAG: hypothetical protein LBR98_00685, partial [Syntrophomonadaceae bacterium]|jgi:molecular chaperone GrpE (heat shock protein)|nr:hypothetical protein [Syntrophomonadaceae bacterium]